MYECYVCGETVNLDMDQYAYKPYDKGGIPNKKTKYRHLWHGAAGSWFVPGLQQYALTLEQAKEKAFKYLTGDSAPYAAPEVKAEERRILEEVERLQALES